ncbi:uncharacterized protein DNG_03806 [Cephalotrichum gorgonifer]|uniref:Uncharacterized protein n=1 Tax=Cephalotrichum gorgonifer TaxID=2041049 RepID=A0AAE8MWV3_9PEZI|nr:uncharacterized protein DNG_03806 [Cephalotrichum gorgonifer]
MSTHQEESTGNPQPPPSISLSQIQALLKTKDDTSRFTGLALLKSVLDNSEGIRQDEETVVQLWSSISPKFLDRLIKTGSKTRCESSKKDTKEMLNLAVSVIHTFTRLLPDSSKREEALVRKVPSLTRAILHSSDETTELILQALVSITSFPEGAREFMEIEDISPLTEVAPTHPEALQVLSFAWLHAQNTSQDSAALRNKIDNTIQQLVSSFKGTDGVTLLEFLGSFLYHADPEVIPQHPKWLDGIISFIRRLVTSRPTPEARYAYTTLSSSLLQVYPTQASHLLFSPAPSEEKSLPFLLTNLVLIDIRSTCPTLLTDLNTPTYTRTSRRIASGYDILSSFIGFLLKSLDDDGPFVMDPDLLLKLQKSISETMFVTVEYLRDRWDASVAGAMGLHPDARSGQTHTSSGSRLTLAWDSADDSADDDPLVLAAVRAMAIWVREDESSALRKEATGLVDMLLELYKSSREKKLDFRPAVLVALEGLLDAKKGKELLLANDAWTILASDLLDIFRRTGTGNNEPEAARGIEIVRILLQIVETEDSGTKEAWMDVITHVAAWYGPETEQSATVYECQVAVLQLCASLLANSSPGMRKRYSHSTSAIFGIASQLRQKIGDDPTFREQLDDVLATIGPLR